MGTRQGWILSLALLMSYIGELVDMLQAENCNGVYINEDFSNQIILLYAVLVVIQFVGYKKQ